MMNVNDITEFFGWCTIINLSIYVISALCIAVFKNKTVNIFRKSIGVQPCELPSLYFKYLSAYKVAIIMFNLTPYIALRLMAI